MRSLAYDKIRAGLNKRYILNCTVMPFLFVIMVWTGVHRDYENNYSVIATQRAFRIHFGIPRAESVPSANTVKLWIRHLE